MADGQENPFAQYSQGNPFAQYATPQQAPAAPAATPEEEVDQFAGIPTSIGGVPLNDELREAILVGRQIEDPKQRRLLQARIAGRLAASAKAGGADDIAASRLGAALRGFGAGLFGLGDIAAAAGTASRGNLSFGEALEAQREYRRALEEEFPITSGLSEVAGAVTGGVGGGNLVRGAASRLGGRTKTLVDAATNLKRGQRVRNVGRVAAAGAAAGAITEGVTEDDPITGAIEGAIGGPLGLGLAKAAGVTIDAVKALKDTPAAKGLRLIARKLGETEDEMARRFLEFKEATGRAPSIADIANPNAVAELREMIARRPTAAAVAGERAEEALRQLPEQTAEAITRGRVTTSRARQIEGRGRVANRQFAEAEDDEITFTGEQVQDLLLDPDLRRAISPTLRRRLDDAFEETGDVESQGVVLFGDEVDDLRQALRKRGGPGDAQKFVELADELEGIARPQSPALARAIDEFAGRSRRAEQVAEGAGVVNAPTREFEVGSRRVAGTPEEAARRVGVRTGLAETAQESASRARSLSNALSEDSGLVRRLQSILPEEEVERLRQVGRVTGRAAGNIRRLAPGVQAEGEDAVRGAVEDTVSALVAAGGKAGAGFKTNAVNRLLDRFVPKGISKRVAENIANDLFDPAKMPEALAALRRAGIRDAEVLDALAVGTAGAELVSD